MAECANHVPEKNVGKSADEMFRELGYKKVPSGAGYYYEKEIGPYRYVCIDTDPFQKYGIKSDIQFTPGEILACAQLIREMEASDA